MKPSPSPFVAFAFATSFTVLPSSAVDKANSGTELTDGASWTGGTAPSTTTSAVWTATSLTGSQTVGSPVTWNQMVFANTSALSLTGSAINLSGAASNGSFNAINDTGATGTRSIANDLILTGVNSTAVITPGNITARLQIIGGTGGLTLGNVTSNGGGLINDANLFLRGTGSSIVNGTLTVDGQLGKGDTGTWTLNGSNTVGWVFVNNGTLRAGNDGAFGSGVIHLGTGGGTTTLASADGTSRSFANGLNFAIGVTMGQTTGGTGALSFGGGVNLGAAQRSIVTNVDTTFSGVVTGGAGGGIAKDGTAVLTLSNANTHSGVTTANAGILALGNDGAFGTSQIRMGGGTIASADASARTFSTGKQIDFAVSSSFGTAATGNLKFDDTVNLGNLSDKTATVNNAVTEFAGVISDGGSTVRIFNKAGTGNLILSGANTYFR